MAQLHVPAFPRAWLHSRLISTSRTYGGLCSEPRAGTRSASYQPVFWMLGMLMIFMSLEIGLDRRRGGGG